MEELNLKTETKTVHIEPGVIHVPYIIINSPYMLVCDSKGTRKVLIVSYKKLFFYLMYRITGIKWFIKLYSK